MIKFPVNGTAYGDLPPIVDSFGDPLTPTTITAKSYKNGSTTETGDSITILTHTEANGLRGWSYNPAGESEFDTWRLEFKVTTGGKDYFHVVTLQAVVPERGTNNALTSSDVTKLLEAVKTATLGVVGVGSTTTSIVTSSLLPAAVALNQFKGLIVKFTDDTTTTQLRGQGCEITASTAGGVLTVSSLTTAPASGDTFVIQ